MEAGRCSHAADSSNVLATSSPHGWRATMTDHDDRRVCPVTGEPLLDGEFLSRGGAARVRVATASMPGLMSVLAYAASHGVRTGEQVGGAGVPSSRAPLNLALMIEVDEMCDAILTWATLLLSHVMGPSYWVRPGDWWMVSRVFDLHEDKLRRWSEAEQCADEVLYSVSRLERLASPGRQRLVYVGSCSQCDADLLVRDPDEDATTCRECGAVEQIAEAWERLLSKARESLLPRTRATRVAEILAGAQIKDPTVRKWTQRGQLAPRARRGGDRLYRVGDIERLATRRM
nr:MAG TPA: TFIIB-TERMINAL DOMAIN, TFIIB, TRANSCRIPTION INITIATION [Caudoviricetes sp.]